MSKPSALLLLAAAPIAAVSRFAAGATTLAGSLGDHRIEAHQH